MDARPRSATQQNANSLARPTEPMISISRSLRYVCIGFDCLVMTTRGLAQPVGSVGELLDRLATVSVSARTWTANDCGFVGVAETRIVEQTELALRRIGLRVVDSSAVEVQVEIGCAASWAGSGDTTATGLHLRLQVVEVVRPIRLPSAARFYGNTWRTSFMGAKTGRIRPSDVSSALNTLLERFENAWLAANPRKP